jgi:Tfp pilus assembly protein PilO
MVPTARILADRRLVVTALALLGVLNLVGLGLVIGPMRSRVQGLTQRATVASLAASAAARDLTEARQTSEGSVTAVRDLQRFYTQVLPGTQPAARQITFVRLAQLARESNLSYDHRAFDQEVPDRDGVLTRATLTMSVFGSYRDLRQFLYALETSEDFVVIRDVRVVQKEDPTEPLEAALTLSTYFKATDGR